MIHDPKNMCCIDEDRVEEKTCDYKVTLFLSNGEVVTSIATNQPPDPASFMELMNRYGYLILEDKNISVNMRHVIYYKVEENK